MGCVFQFRLLEAKTESDAVQEADKVIDACLYESGHGGFSGTFAECTGVTVRKDVHFSDQYEAEEWLDNNAEKWGDAIIVKLNDGYCMGANCSS